jgi:hypothetical protein
MTLADVIHHLVDNSHAFDAEGVVDAHKAVSEHFGEDDLHLMVPSPDAEKAQTDEKAAKVAALRLELAALEPDAPADAPAAPVPVADQRAAGVAPDDTVTVADQNTGTPLPFSYPAEDSAG